MEVADEGRHLSVFRGFLKVTQDDTELGRVPLDDITALILSGHQITLSKNLMVELSERKAIIVVCGENWHPISYTLPFDAHYESAGTLRDQISAPKPLKKQLWKKVVQAKINNQVLILQRHKPETKVIKRLEMLRRKTKSGDPDNTEAQAAKLYWPELMGNQFRRDRSSADINGFLNYGYTVLRAATARAVCAAGLHPSLGIHHGSRVNAFALVDDLMEPFRPLVDSVAKNIYSDGDKKAGLTAEKKRALAAVLREDMVTDVGISPVINCLAKLAQSMTASLACKQVDLTIAKVRGPGQLL